MLTLVALATKVSNKKFTSRPALHGANIQTIKNTNILTKASQCNEPMSVMMTLLGQVYYFSNPISRLNFFYLGWPKIGIDKF